MTIQTPAPPGSTAVLDRPRALAGDPRRSRTGRRSGSDFAPLSRAVREAGLLRRSTPRALLSVAGAVAALAVAWAVVLVVGSTGSLWALPLAVVVGVLTTRAAFLGHDAGHHQLFASDRGNDLVGLLIGNLGLGMSYGWWKTKHTRHHAHPNHSEHDPDVAAGALVWTVEQAVGRAGFTAWVTRHQAALFFPMLTLEAFNIRASAVTDLRSRPPGPRRRLEIALIVAHYVWFSALLFTVLSPGLAVAVLLISQMTFGLHLGSVFAPSHKGMPMADDSPEWTHLRRQVLTSRNVSGGRVTDWMMGGLNHQIEHHLFPSMPRHRLRSAVPLVRAHCEAHGLPYSNVPLLTCYRLALRHLDDVGRRGIRDAD